MDFYFLFYFDLVLHDIFLFFSVLITTLTQLLKIKKKRLKKKNFSKTPALKKNCFKKGAVLLVRIRKPKKPNSAVRQVAKVTLSNFKRVTVRLPGIGYLCVRFNRVLIRGGRANDLPGVSYSAVRGVYDFASLFFKKYKRSKYGASRLEESVKHVRRCFRNL